MCTSPFATPIRSCARRQPSLHQAQELSRSSKSGGGRGIRTPKGRVARWISSPLPYQLRLALRAQRDRSLRYISTPGTFEPGDELLFEEPGVDPPRLPFRRLEDLGEEAARRRDALDMELVEGATHPSGGLRPVPIPHDDLPEHRIVVHRDLAAHLDVAVEADARAG